MKKLLFMLPVALLCWACSSSIDEGLSKGPGSETTNGIVALVGDAPAAFAGVALRKVDFTVGEFAPENAMVQPDIYAGENGSFNLDYDSSDVFRLTVVHGGAAFTQVFSGAEMAGVDTVVLEPTGSVTGAVTVPEGSDFVWVGVLGMDVMVKSDSNGQFSLPQLPSTDSLKLYFVKEGGKKSFKEVDVKPQAYKNEVVDAVEPVKKEDPKDDGNVKIVAIVDGVPAAGAVAALRAPDFEVEKLVAERAVVVGDYEADENGMLSFAKPDSGSFRFTVTQSGNVYSKVLTAKQIAKLDTVTLVPSGTYVSRVTLMSDMQYAYAGVKGLDVLVKTDENGNYVFPSLPVGDSIEFYFVAEKKDKLTATLKTVVSEDASEFQSPSMLLQNFEGKTFPNWYINKDTLGTTMSPEVVEKGVEYDSTRKSKVFHGKYKLKAFEDYAWTLVGTSLRETAWNLSLLDSIVFYAKGNGQVRVAFENWDKFTEELGMNLKASSEWIDVDSTWQRIVVTPAQLYMNAADKMAGSFPWSTVKNYVKQIHFFASGGTEFYIDDIWLYGALF